MFKGPSILFEIERSLREGSRDKEGPVMIN